MKFSYQQLPVSLKLIYTILQVLNEHRFRLRLHGYRLVCHKPFLCSGNVKVWGARHFVQHDELSEDPLSPRRVLVSCPQRSSPVPGLHSGKDAHSMVCVGQCLRKKCSAPNPSVSNFRAKCDFFVFQFVVHVKIWVLSASISGCASASSRFVVVAWSRHLLEPHQLKFQQQRLENTLWSRSETN